MKHLFPIVLVCLAALGCAGQTNCYYQAKNIDATLGLTVSSPDFFNNHAGHAYGDSLEVDYWQTAGTSTGVELGSYNARDWQLGVVDHMAAIESFRVVGPPLTVGEIANPFSMVLSRSAFELKTGAETYFVDGSKDVEIGLRYEFAITRKMRVAAGYWQHFRTNPADDGGTFVLGLTSKF